MYYFAFLQHSRVSFPCWKSHLSRVAPGSYGGMRSVVAWRCPPNRLRSSPAAAPELRRVPHFHFLPRFPESFIHALFSRLSCLLSSIFLNRSYTGPLLLSPGVPTDRGEGVAGSCLLYSVRATYNEPAASSSFPSCLISICSNP